MMSKKNNTLKFFFSHENIKGLTENINKYNNRINLIFFTEQSKEIFKRITFPKIYQNKLKLYFIKTDSFVFKGVKYNNGFLQYIFPENFESYFFTQQDPIVLLDHIKNSKLNDSILILTNIHSVYNLNKFLFDIYNTLGFNKRYCGAIFKSDENAIYHNNRFYSHFILILTFKSNIYQEYYYKFWDKFFGPFLITSIEENGYNSINWINSVKFFSENFNYQSLKTLQQNLKFFPLYFSSFKNYPYLISQSFEPDFSTTMIKTTFKIHNFQMAYLAKLNQRKLNIELEKMLSAISKNNIFIFIDNYLINFFKTFSIFGLRLYRKIFIENFIGPSVLGSIIQKNNRFLPFITTSTISLINLNK